MNITCRYYRWVWLGWGVFAVDQTRDPWMVCTHIEPGKIQHLPCADGQWSGRDPVQTLPDLL